MGKEEWRDVVGFEGLYQVSSFGRVFSQKRNHPQHGHFIGGQIIAQKIDRGYLCCNLWKGGKSYNLLVHRLVAIAFIPNTLNKKEINHKNRTRNDNNVCNLEWSTRTENHKHAESGGKTIRPPLKVAQLEKQTGAVVVVWFSLAEAARAVRVSQSAISHCINGKNKKKRASCAGYYWQVV